MLLGSPLNLSPSYRRSIGILVAGYHTQLYGFWGATPTLSGLLGLELGSSLLHRKCFTQNHLSSSNMKDTHTP